MSCRRTRKYDDTILTAALAACRAGMSFGRAEKQYGVPKATLYTKLNGIAPETCSKGGPPPVLGIAVEKKLARHIEVHAQQGFPLLKSDVLDLVATIVKEEKLPNPFTLDRPGETWMSNFLHRHPQLNSFKRRRKNENVVSEGTVESWFHRLTEYLTELGQADLLQHPERILYADENTFELGTEGKRLQSQCDEDQVCLLSGFSASGDLLPTMIVLSEERIATEVSDSLAEGFFIGKSSSGWVTSKTFLFYLQTISKHLLDKGMLSKDGSQKVVLFVDALKRNISLEVSYFCNRVGIILVNFFSTFARILESCDAQILKQIEKAWDAAWIYVLDGESEGETRISSISLATFCKEIPPAFLLIEKEKMQKVFEVTGIFPFSPHRVGEIENSEDHSATTDAAATVEIGDQAEQMDINEFPTTDSGPTENEDQQKRLDNNDLHTTDSTLTENEAEQQMDINELILENEMSTSVPMSEIIYDSLITSNPTLTIEVFCTEDVSSTPTPSPEEASVNASLPREMMNDLPGKQCIAFNPPTSHSKESASVPLAASVSSPELVNDHDQVRESLHGKKNEVNPAGSLGCSRKISTQSISAESCTENAEVVVTPPLSPALVVCVQELQVEADTSREVGIKLESLDNDESNSELEVISSRHNFDFVSVKREHEESELDFEDGEVGARESVAPHNNRAETVTASDQRQSVGRKRPSKRRKDGTDHRNVDLSNATCSFCSVPIETIIELVQHFTSKHATLFTCHQCQASILTLDQLLLHLETRHSDNNDASNAVMYTMTYLNFERKLVKFLNHLEKKQEHSCLICDKEFPVVSQLWQHLCKNHNYCVSCCTFLQNNSAFQQHKVSHLAGEIKIYKCVSCCVEFRTKAAVERHAQIYHRSSEYSHIAKPSLSFSSASDSYCPYCGLTSRSSDILQRHIAEHRLLQCGKCKQAFVHICATSWMCTLCLISSENTPDNQDCEICPLHQRMEFTKKDHQRNQKQAVPIITDIPCIFCHNFKGNSLEIYEHTESIHHCCRVCVLQFETAEDLQFHKSNHEPIVPECNRCCSSRKQIAVNTCPALSKKKLISNQQCPYCCIIFIPRQNTLMSHMSVKHNIKVCENCNSRFVADVGNHCSSCPS